MDHTELVLGWLDAARSCIDEAAAALAPGRAEPQEAGLALVKAIGTLDEAFNAWCTPEPVRHEPAPVIDLAERRWIRSRCHGELRRRRSAPRSPRARFVTSFTFVRSNKRV